MSPARTLTVTVSPAPEVAAILGSPLKAVRLRVQRHRVVLELLVARHLGDLGEIADERRVGIGAARRPCSILRVVVDDCPQRSRDGILAGVPVAPCEVRTLATARVERELLLHDRRTPERGRMDSPLERARADAALAGVVHEQPLARPQRMGRRLRPGVVERDREAGTADVAGCVVGAAVEAGVLDAAGWDGRRGAPPRGGAGVAERRREGRPRVRSPQ
jgi:hypothetical protein